LAASEAAVFAESAEFFAESAAVFAASEAAGAEPDDDAGLVSDFSHPTNNPAATVETANRTANDPKNGLSMSSSFRRLSLPGSR
jgi:hypothetical protein